MIRNGHKFWMNRGAARIVTHLTKATKAAFVHSDIFRLFGPKTTRLRKRKRMRRFYATGDAFAQAK